MQTCRVMGIVRGEPARTAVYLHFVEYRIASCWYMVAVALDIRYLCLQGSRTFESHADPAVSRRELHFTDCLGPLVCGC